MVKRLIPFHFPGTSGSSETFSSAVPYFAGASGFPDFMIFRLDMLQHGAAGIDMTGFFDNDWQLSPSETVTSK